MEVARRSQRRSSGAVRMFSGAYDGPPLSLNMAVRQMEPSATLAINEHSQLLQAQGKEVFKFGLGQSPFPVPDCMVEALKAHAGEKDYLAVAGLLPLREEIAKWLNRYAPGREHTASDIVIGPGSKELLFLTQLVYNSELLLPTGSWVSYQPQAAIIGHSCKHLACSMEANWKLTPEVLAAECKKDPTRPRTLVLNYPCNPTGATYSDEELAALTEVMREYRILVLSDEIYGRITFDGSYTSLANHYPEGTVIMNGASKWLGSGGWRVGFAAFPKNLHAVRAGVLICASETFTSVSAPLQYACIPGFSQSAEVDDYIAASAKTLHPLSETLCAKLREAGASVRSAEGGFYVMPDFSKCARSAAWDSDADMVLDILTNTAVAMLPGSNFGVAPNKMLARMAFVDFDGTEAIKNVDSQPDIPASEFATNPEMQAWLRKYCGKVLQGADALSCFLRSAPDA